jgi:hypothetical protein
MPFVLLDNSLPNILTEPRDRFSLKRCMGTGSGRRGLHAGVGESRSGESSHIDIDELNEWSTSVGSVLVRVGETVGEEKRNDSTRGEEENAMVWFIVFRSTGVTESSASYSCHAIDVWYGMTKIVPTEIIRVSISLPRTT